MRILQFLFRGRQLLLLLAFSAFAVHAHAQTITEIIDATGDGGSNPLSLPSEVAVDGSGNVYVSGTGSDNAFKIVTPGTCSTVGTPCAITEIIDAVGDGGANPLQEPYGIAVDGSGNVYVTGWDTHNAFKITPGGVITEIIDASGDGAGNGFCCSRGVAADGSGNVYVTGDFSHNVFKITPGGVITEIIDVTGDGAGNGLGQPFRVTSNGSGNVYVAGALSDNAFMITPGGVITEIIDATGDGGSPLDLADGLAVDGSGNVYVAGFSSHNVFKITPGGVITEIIDATGDGAGNGLSGAALVTVDGSGNVYVAGIISRNAFKIVSPGTCSTVGTPCVITEIIDATGDGGGNALTGASGIAVDGSGNVYVTGFNSHNVFKITLVPPPPEQQAEDLIEDIADIVDGGGLGAGNGNALTKKLEGILAKIDQGKPKVAINKLNAFINQVQSLIDGGDVSPADGQALIDAALAIISGLEAELGKTGSVSEVLAGEVPEAYELGQNYPNPFNPETRIQYALPEEASVHIVVFDALGRTVANLVRGEQLPAGQHAVAWNAENLPSGVYFYRLQAGDFVQTKAMFLAK